MCINASQWIPCKPQCSPVCRLRQRRSKVRIRRLTMRRRSGKAVMVVGREMKLKNLKLYLENRNFIEENEKLRKKALLLHQENRALMSEFQQKFSNIQESPTLFLHNH